MIDFFGSFTSVLEMVVPVVLERSLRGNIPGFGTSRNLIQFQEGI